jgi:hypothetical protein
MWHVCCIQCRCCVLRCICKQSLSSGRISSSSIAQVGCILSIAAHCGDGVVSCVLCAAAPRDTAMVVSVARLVLSIRMVDGPVHLFVPLGVFGYKRTPEYPLVPLGPLPVWLLPV